MLPLCEKLGSGVHPKPCAGLAQPPNNSTGHDPRVIQSGIYLAYIRTTRPVFHKFHKPHTHQNLPATQRRGIRAALRRRDPGSASSPPPNFRPTSNDYQLLESNRGPPLRAWRGGIPTLVNNRAAVLVLTASAHHSGERDYKVTTGPRTSRERSLRQPSVPVGGDPSLYVLCVVPSS